MKKIPIKERLILYFVLLSITSIAVVSLFSIFEARKGIRERAFSQLILLRDLRREQIRMFYEERGRELVALAGSPLTVKISGENIDWNSNGIENPEIVHLLDLVMDSTYCNSLSFIFDDGQEFQLKNTGKEYSILSFPGILSAAIITPEDTIMAGTRGYWIREVAGPDNRIILQMIARVETEDSPVRGWLISDLKYEALQNLIFKPDPGTGMGRTGEAYLVGSDGLMRTPSRFIAGSVMATSVSTAGFHSSLKGIDGTGVYDDYRGVKVLGAYGIVTVGDFKQVILAEIDVGEALKPLSVIRTDILVVSSLIILVIFAITWFLAHGITQPLVRLKNVANFISAGNYDQKVEKESDDEIGELTDAFNAMVKEIGKTTSALKEREERLRHFYEATLDGIILHEENRMILFNSAMLKLTGFPEDEFSRFSLKDLLVSSKEIICSKDQVNEMYESNLVMKNKSLLPVEVQESCVDYNGRSIRATVIRDISNRKKIEAELADERNKRVRAVFDGKDAEQHRLSRELHDGLGQQLAAGKLILESSLYQDDRELRLKIREVQKIFDQIIGDIRRISHDLSPSILHEFGLKAAMENLCREIMQATGIRIEFGFSLPEPGPDELVSSYLYRIAQEAMQNVQLHSGASEARMILKPERDCITLIIEDNGCGFEVSRASATGGNGLYNIRERVNILKGRLSLVSRPGHGTKISVRIPSHQAGQNHFVHE